MISLRSQRVVVFDDVQHFRLDRNRVALQAVGIAETVEPFVVRTQDRRDARERLQRQENRLGVDRVTLELGGLLRRSSRPPACGSTPRATSACRDRTATRRGECRVAGSRRGRASCAVACASSAILRTLTVSRVPAWIKLANTCTVATKPSSRSRCRAAELPRLRVPTDRAAVGTRSRSATSSRARQSRRAGLECGHLRYALTADRRMAGTGGSRLVASSASSGAIVHRDGSGGHAACPQRHTTSPPSTYG